MTREFIGEVRARWMTGTENDRDMILLKPFKFRDKNGKIWTAPKGSTINGASIPAALWTFGPPYVGNYRFASVVHDHYCVVQTESWQDTHYMFYEGCRAGGVGLIKSKAMYAAVYIGGPRWKVKKRGLFGRILKTQDEDDDFESLGDPAPQPDMDQEKFRQLQEWIESDNPDISRIEEVSTNLMQEAS